MKWFKDTVQVSDKVSVTKLINPKCILDEVTPLLVAVDKDTTNGQFISIYILLQVYVENHFHYYLGFLVGDSFSSSKPIPCWQGKDSVPKKIICFETVLSASGIEYDKTLLDRVVGKYSKLTAIRNALAHGHPLTETTEDGKVTTSKAKEYLDIKTLRDTIIATNEMMLNWNTFVTQLEEQTIAIKSSQLPEVNFFKNCKFTTTLDIPNT